MQALTAIARSQTIQKLAADPKKALENAGSGKMEDLVELANFWDSMGKEFLSLGILDVFLRHVSLEEAPTSPTPTTYGTRVLVERAWASLVGLSKVGNVMRSDGKYGERIVEGWPGVFAWSQFLYSARIEPTNSPPEVKRAALDLISGVWYSLSRSNIARKVMTNTKGSIELATHLWIIEDMKPPSTIGIPAPSAALDSLLSGDEMEDVHDRVLKAAGLRVQDIVIISMSRLRTALDSPMLHEPRATIYLDLISQLSRPPNHPLRLRFLNASIIVICTKTAVKVTSLLNGRPVFHPGLLDLVVSSLGYLMNCLESTDGFSWVIQSLNAGLLQAFVDFAPHLSKICPEDRDMVLHIVQTLLPKYLVYRSVIQAVDGTIRKVQNSPNAKGINETLGAGAWRKFCDLARERQLITLQAKSYKGKNATCDNVKCQKIDTRNNFRKCSSCFNTLYCSRECQIIAWKEGGHKTMCALKQQELLEGKSRTITRADAAFLHNLATRDARHHLPHLRQLAKQYFPETTSAGLVVAINYLVVPPTYKLLPLDEYGRHQRLHSQNSSSNAEARNEALIERARENPGKFTIIQSKIANGFGIQLVLTIVTGGFWDDDDDGNWGGSEDEDGVDGTTGILQKCDGDDDDDRKNIEGVDIALARMSLNGILRSMGKPEAF